MKPTVPECPAEQAAPDPTVPAVHPSEEVIDALARLTAGLAHDFNNVLAVILGNLAALRAGAEERGDRGDGERTAAIEDAARRAARVTDQLLAFAGKQMLRPLTVSIYSTLERMRDSLRLAAGESTRVRLRGADEASLCRVDTRQLEAALVALVANARDAMPPGGTITIACQNETISLARARPSGVPPGEYVRIDVRDTGCGMAPELQARAFEPFCTTKPVGEGSGLGLSQVQGFVRQSGGWVELRSRPGVGTTVSLLLPRFTGDVAPAPSPVDETASAHGGGRTVLLVEDEEDLRETLRDTLEDAGYRVLCASDASGARRILVSDEKLALLFSETILPGDVSGMDLAQDACRMRPGLRVLLISAADDEARLQAGRDAGISHITKPFPTAVLLRALSAILTDGGDAEARGEAAAGARPGSAIRLGVLPFKTLQGSSESQLAQGLAEEITTALSRFRWISSIAPASVAAVAPERYVNGERWRALDLDFLLEGTLRRDGPQVRIMARLVRVRGTGEVAWTNRFDGDLTGMLTLQDRIAADTVAQVGPEVLLWEGEEAAARRKVDPTAYELMLRAIPAIYRLDQAGFQQAGAWLEASLRMDPGNAAAHSWLAHWYLLLIGQGWASDITAAIHRADALAERAVMLDPADARGLTIAGHVSAFLRKAPEDARHLHERALAMNPNLALAWCYSGLAHSYMGQQHEAVRRIGQAQHLAPHDPHGFFFDTALIVPHLLSGAYETAARLGRKALAAHPRFSSAHKGLLAALGHLGEAEEAARVWADLRALEPGFTVREAVARSPLVLKVDLDRYADGLRLAGVPED